MHEKRRGPNTVEDGHQIGEVKRDTNDFHPMEYIPNQQRPFSTDTRVRTNGNNPPGEHIYISKKNQINFLYLLL